MKRFRITSRRLTGLLLLLFCFAACSKVDDEPPGPEAETPSVTGEEPALPVNPDPPGNTGGDTESIPPAPPPEYPSVELAAVWAENGLSVSQTAYQNTFKKGGTTTMTASGRFPQTGVTAVDVYYKNCRDDFERLCKLKAEDAANEPRAFEYEANFTVECDAGGLFSISRTEYRYEGGTRGETRIYCETFLISTGRMLTLDDFFTVGRDGYTPRMLEYVYAAIDAAPGEFWADAKQTARDLFPYDTFCVTKDGISVFYSEENIGAYTLGTLRVDIPWGALAEMFELPG